MQKSERKATLQAMVSEGVLTPEGKNWLIEVTDPFHDEQIVLNGFPDMNVAASVVQCIKSTQNLKKNTTSITDTGNWDANIVLWPNPNQITDTMLLSNTGTGGTDTNYAWETLPVPTSDMGLFPIGGATAYCVPSGSETYGGEVPAGGYSSDDLTLSLPTTFFDGNTRIIAMGLEVINTTSALHRQGSCIVYRMPTPEPQQKYVSWIFQTETTAKSERKAELESNDDYLDDRKSFQAAMKALHDRSRKKKEPGAIVAARKLHTEFLQRWGLDEESLKSKREKRLSRNAEPAATSLTKQMYSSTYAMSHPPKTAEEAMFLAGSQQWEAEKGAYIPATMNTLDNPAKFAEPQTIIVLDAAVDNNGGSGEAVFTGFDQVPTLFVSTVQFPPVQHIAPFNIGGVYFLGLSPETTLTVSVNWYIERFPDPFETDLVVLASPSPGFDSTAMKIYADSMRKLPVGVPQGMNPLGEWFNSVVNQVAKVVSPALHAAGAVNPWMGGLGWVADQVAEATEAGPATKPRKARKAGQPAPKPNLQKKKKQSGKQKKLPGSAARPRNPPPVPPRAGRRALGMNGPSPALKRSLARATSRMK